MLERRPTRTRGAPARPRASSASAIASSAGHNDARSASATARAAPSSISSSRAQALIAARPTRATSAASTLTTRPSTSTHAYALTGHAAQGATVDRAFVLLRDEGALREWGYVACSRARTQTRLYATGESLEGEQHGSLLTPRDPTARLANALERSGAEKLASVQTLPETSEVTRRARERCRRQREQALETAEQRLSAAQEQLRRLGRLGHRRQRAELRAEISHQRTALRLARRQLTESPVEQPELRPKRAARTRLQPEPSMPTRTRDRGRHLDLEL